MRPRSSGFTLIEILVVIALVAVLSTTAILVLNPVELLRQSRDSVRTSDLATLNKALGIYDTDQSSGSLGSATTVYVSLPDSSATCANLGLPSLPSGYTYACSTSDNYRKVDGTGWIPVDFTDISVGSPIASLPVDPVNTTSTREYYTYTPGGSWELTATLEATKNKLGGASDKVSTDGGDSPSLVEVGSNTALLPIDYGDPALVGYWKWDENTGTSSKDSSGMSSTMSTFSAANWGTGRMGYAKYFDRASNEYAYTPTISSVVTIAFWINLPSQTVGANGNFIVDARTLGVSNAYFFLTSDASAGYEQIFYPGVAAAYVNGQAVNISTYLRANLPMNRWIHVAMVLNGTGSGATAMFRPYGSAADQTATNYLDELRFYSRALSAAEVLALYESAP